MYVLFFAKSVENELFLSEFNIKTECIVNITFFLFSMVLLSDSFWPQAALFHTRFIHCQCTHIWIFTFGTVGLMESITYLVSFTRLNSGSPLKSRSSRSGEWVPHYRHGPSPIVRYPHDPLPSFYPTLSFESLCAANSDCLGRPSSLLHRGSLYCFVPHRSLSYYAIEAGTYWGETAKDSTRFSYQPV